jgi:phosphohistidine phosphatase
MKRLFIIRHAKSGWDINILSDHDRPLDERGLQDAPLMGKHLKSIGIQFDSFISSTAYRALTTAKLIATELDFPLENIIQIRDLYHASETHLLEEVQSISPDINTAAIFTHNPGISYFVNGFYAQRLDEMPTCGVAEIHFDVENWQEADLKNGKVIELYFPKKLW